METKRTVKFNEAHYQGKYKKNVSQIVNNNGYVMTIDKKRLGKLGMPTRIPKHRLVWESNFGIPPKDFHIHHIDRDKWNNSIENLRLVHKREHPKMHKKGTKSEKGKPLNTL